MPGRGLKAPPRIWALLGARAGDNDQVMALAEALDLPFEMKRLTFNRWRHLGPRLLGPSLLSLTRASRRNILSEPPPDLTISTGHRSVAVVRALRKRSRGRMQAIHVGFPRVSPGYFSLVITTEQFPIPDHPNLLRIPYALTPAATNAADHDDEGLRKLPGSMSLMIIGGPTLFWNLDQPRLLERLDAMIGEARSNSGSVLVTTSRRTPVALRRQIAHTLDGSGVPSVLAEPGKTPTLGSLLAAADTIFVTAESVSMVSDAIWTDKPIALISVKRSASGKVAFALNDVLRPGRRLYPQDLRYFWRALNEVGVSDQLSRPRTSTEAVITMILNRVRPILKSIR